MTNEQATEKLLEMREVLNKAVEALVQNEELQADRDYWKEKHDELVNASIKHSEAMMGGILQLAIGGHIKT